jgi:hypothetical protein
MSRPPGALGRSYKTWRTSELEKVLSHYQLPTNVQSKGKNKKADLYSRFQKFAEEHQIIPRDGMHILGLGKRQGQGSCTSPIIVEQKACLCFQPDAKQPDSTGLNGRVAPDASSNETANESADTVITRTHSNTKANPADDSHDFVYDKTFSADGYAFDPSLFNCLDPILLDADKNVSADHSGIPAPSLHHHVSLGEDSTDMAPLKYEASDFIGPNPNDLSFPEVSLQPALSLSSTTRPSTKPEVEKTTIPPTLKRPKADLEVSPKSKKKPRPDQPARYSNSQVQPTVEESRAATPKEESTPSTSSSIGKKSPERMPGMRTCTICADQISSGNDVNGLIFSDCNERHDMCLACVAHSLQTQFETRVWNQLSCPICDVRLSYADVKKYAPGTVFERYYSVDTLQDHCSNAWKGMIS